MIKLSNIARDLLQESITQNARSMRYVVNKVLEKLASSSFLPSEDNYNEYLIQVLRYSMKGASYSDTLKLPLLADEYSIPEEVHVYLGDALDDLDIEYIKERFSPTQNFIDFLDQNRTSGKDEVKFILFPQVRLEDDMSKAVYNQVTKYIRIYIPIDDFKDFMIKKSFVYYEFFFKDMLGASAVHELQHAYDDWRSKGKALIKPEKYIDLALTRMRSKEDFINFVKAYLNLSSEKAAHTQEALKILLDDLSKLQSPEDLLKAYKNKELGIISHNPIIKSLLDQFIDTALLPNVMDREITQEQRRKVYKIFYKILSSEMEALEKELNRNK